MGKGKYKYFVGDFETTVFDEQQYTEVWASAIVEIGSEDVHIHHRIEDTFYFLKKQRCNCIVYYHNLKFDGEFWLYYLLKIGMKQAVEETRDENGELLSCEWVEPYKMQNNTFAYTISDRGAWYSLKIKIYGHTIELRDSLKLLPFAVRQLGKNFKTKHQKLDMEYKGFRWAGCEITEDEKRYIANDVLVVSEALVKLFDLGLTKLTIGSCCLDDFKKTISKEMYESDFPDLTIYDFSEIDTNIDYYIRRSYRGGWCYVVPDKTNIIINLGTTADVNSLYPSMMHSDSGNYYPVGMPHFWQGNLIPESARIDHHFYFIRFKCRFYLKKDKLPFLQIKGSKRYKGTECLKTSDVKIGDKYFRFIYDSATGEILDTDVTLTMTMMDFELFREHYNLVDFEILDGCWFETKIGIFDDYINKWKKLKIEAEKTGNKALRTICKLMLNNLYGKMAANTDSSFKLASLPEELVTFVCVDANDKQAGFIPIGSAITSYARCFTIRHAQANYDSFIYADTDSIHCNCKPEDIKMCKIDDTEFCCWKLESTWDKAIFVRQKTYIEHVIEEDLKPVKPYYNIKCAGMPKNCKDVFERSLNQELAFDDEDICDFNRNLINRKCTLLDFRLGLKIYGKLVPKRIRGGIVLKETTFELKG